MRFEKLQRMGNVTPAAKFSRDSLNCFDVLWVSADSCAGCDDGVPVPRELGGYSVAVCTNVDIKFCNQQAISGCQHSCHESGKGSWKEIACDCFFNYCLDLTFFEAGKRMCYGVLIDFCASRGF